MKNSAYLYSLFLFFCLAANAQTFTLVATGSNKQEQATLDSIGYIQKHRNLDSIKKEGDLLLENAQKKGYLEATYRLTQPSTDSIYRYLFELRGRTKFVHLDIKGVKSIFASSIYPIINDSIRIPYSELSKLLDFGLKKLEAKGESLSKLQVTKISKHKNKLIGVLDYLPEKSRTLDALVINGNTNFPKGYLKSLSKLYRKNTFNQALVNRLKKEFDSYPFCTQIKSPEIQFTKDSTSLYIYVQKRSANTFDGFIGFSNSETKNITLSGYVDVLLQNILNTGESVSITWKSNGNQQKSFAGQVELPYIFNSPIALKAQLQLFKQDSTFQNTKTALHLGYLFRFHKRLYLGYQSAESSDIQNTNSASLSDFKNYFTSVTYEYVNNTGSNLFFTEKSKLKIEVGTGSRSTFAEKNKQYYFATVLKQDWQLNDKNHLIIKNDSYYLQSEAYLVNELARFGGINSLVGFNENSLQANFFSITRTEYRCKFSPSLYWSALVDYGLYQDQTISSKTSAIAGLGTGIKLATKTGLLNLFYGVGSAKNQTFNTKNALIHLSLTSYF
ncbi:MAG: hypothetical protein RIT03_780 [Bacteroidota bacterium]